MSQQLEILKNLVNSTKRKALKSVEDYPVLDWAMRYHTNTRGEIMNFTDRHYLLDLYKNFHKYTKLVVEKSVQIGLSELFVVSAHREANMGMTVFYVLPKYEGRNRFVSNRIERLHKRNKFYREQTEIAVKEQGAPHRKSLIGFGNGVMAFVGSNVEDEFIEIPVDSAYIDEKEQCTWNHLEMVPDRLSASPYKFQREIANPRIKDKGIDARFGESSQAVWNIKCDHCGEWFTPDFFQHVVKEVGIHQYDVLDKDAEEGVRSPRLIHDCGHPVDRLKKGEWVHKYPDREWTGFRVSQLYFPMMTLGELLWATEFGWMGCIGNPYKEQVFINNRLGLPYAKSGSVILEHELDNLQKPYKYPVEPSQDRLLVMGVDVGATIHAVVREVRYEGDMPVARLCTTLALNTFEDLKREIRRWQPRSIVIDANPEIHQVNKIQREFKQVWSCMFANNKLNIGKDRKTRSLKVDRTACMDQVLSAVHMSQLELPLGSSQILDRGIYYKQMMAPTRTLAIDEDNPEKTRYIWEAGKKDDHYFLAEAYCQQAIELLTNIATLKFYSEENERMEAESAKKKLPYYPIPSFKADIDKATEYQKSLSTTPESFLKDLSTYTPSFTPPVPSRSDEAIRIEIYGVAMDLLQVRGEAAWVEDFGKAAGLSEDNAKQFLVDNGFKITDLGVFFAPES